MMPDVRFIVGCDEAKPNRTVREGGYTSDAIRKLIASYTGYMWKLGAMKDEPGQTPTGFLKHAQEFLNAANLVLNKVDGVSIPAYFLLGRSIELSLKAYLLRSGVPISELKNLRKFGHNLYALLVAAKEHGIESYVQLESIESSVIELLSYDYADKRLEYRITGGKYRLPRIDVTCDVAQKLAFEMAETWSNRSPLGRAQLDGPASGGAADNSGA